MVNLEQILALENARVREKEAEMLAALMEFTCPARQQIDGARRGLGTGVPREFLTLFVSEENRAAAIHTVKFCTATLFDVYAETAFAHVFDAEPFIALLPLIGERVRLKLQVIDKDEVEVRRHKWESAAWAREKPTLRRRLFKWLMALLEEPVEKKGSGPIDSKAKVLSVVVDDFSRSSEVNISRAINEDTPDPSSVGIGSEEAISSLPAPADISGAISGPAEAGSTLGDVVRRQPEFHKRAEWLRVRLRERAWDKNDLASQGGPDRKTVQKILDGYAVREDVLEKLATALSKKSGKLTVLDIPLD